ncbi:MAG: DUF115 domain-containing protein [Flavobacteriia bacterium]|nr:DUF115 domain-containing protein [Flavobacteriia bacterium]
MFIKRFHPKRLIPGIFRRILEKKYNFLWNNSLLGKNNKSFISNIKNKFKDEKLFLIANGPSLKDMDLTVLKDKHVMCMNRFYIYFDKIGFTPEFIVCVEDFVLEQFADDFNKLNIKYKFMNWRKHKIIPNSNFLKESFAFNPFFQTDLTKPTHFGGTVTFACLQLAYYLGFKEVIIVGMDHSFKEKGIANKIEVRKYEKDESHFDANYFPKGMKWKLPDLVKSEISYNIAKNIYENSGRKIIDCTIKGKCTIFEKGEFSNFI